ncbi:hypothetical protein ACA910_018791 [Epithemia clementina (nom. ined.)]
MGPILGKAPEELLDADRDYYAYHQHLWVYLYRKEGLAFNDLPSTEATRQAFERFVQQYNAGALEKEYYQTQLPPAVLDEAKTTRHTWSFVATQQQQEPGLGGGVALLEEHDSNLLRAVQASVRKETTASSK